jgi:uracil-DNA glycosylase family 4
MHNPYAQALDFLVDAGVTVTLMNEPNNRYEISSNRVTEAQVEIQSKKMDSSLRQNDDKSTSNKNAIQPHADIIKQANDVAASAKTLDDLKSAVQNFDGLSLKKTATQIVFADGNPEAKIMVIGDAPGADEDRQGKPFVGVSGQLLDKIFDCINLNRGDSLYISNILNWRPPGNRTPTKEEMDIAHPFIKRHIELINPDMLVLCGGVAAQTLLQSKESISRLRGKIHDYDETTKAIATYHPAFLLRTPLQKKKVWQDMLMLQDHING